MKKLFILSMLALLAGQSVIAMDLDDDNLRERKQSYETSAPLNNQPNQLDQVKRAYPDLFNFLDNNKQLLFSSTSEGDDYYDSFGHAYTNIHFDTIHFAGSKVLAIAHQCVDSGTGKKGDYTVAFNIEKIMQDRLYATGSHGNFYAYKNDENTSKDKPQSIVFNQDKSLKASLEQKTATVCDAKTDKLLATFIHKCPVYLATFNKNKTLFATVSGNGYTYFINVWSLNKTEFATWLNDISMEQAAVLNQFYQAKLANKNEISLSGKDIAIWESIPNDIRMLSEKLFNISKHNVYRKLCPSCTIL